MIKVFFDYSSVSEGHKNRGIGYYAENLLVELNKSKNIKLVSEKNEADIVHFPYFDFFFNTLNPVRGKKNIVTIYDTIPLVYPSNYPPGLKGKINFIKQKKKLSLIDAVITISETSKKDIVRFLDINQKKVFPIHLAANSAYKKLKPGKRLYDARKKYNLPEKFVLYVGDVNYNKNISKLAAACLLVNIDLVIVGKSAVRENVDNDHPENKPFVEFLEKYGSNPKIKRLGFVETQDLVKVFNLASVYCQPSFYEGFGLPVIEAQSCRLPVIASRTQALVEVADDSCLYFDPYNEKDIADTINKVLKDKNFKQALIKRGTINTNNYSWEKAAERTIKIYQSL